MLVRFYNHVPLEFYGGGEVTALYLLRAFRKAGLDVAYCASSNYNGPERVPRAVVREELGDIPYFRTRFVSPWRGPISSFYRPYPPAEMLGEPGVHLILVDRPPSPDLLRTIRGSNGRAVFLLHGFSLESFFPPSPLLISFQLLLRAYFRLNSNLLRDPRLTFQVFNSSSQATLARYGVRPSQVRVIPSGVDFDRYRVGSPADTFEVVFLGRLERTAKGLDLLKAVLTAMSRRFAPDFRVSVVGVGPDSSFLRGLARDSRVALLGFVSESEKVEILARSSVMIITSFMEPFSLSAIEGLASGLPVITTPCIGPSGIIGSDPIFGEVVRPSVKAFLSAIRHQQQRWSSSRSEYLSSKRERRRRAEELFSEHQMSRSYVSLVREGYRRSAESDPQ